MSDQAEIKIEDDILYVCGNLDFSSVMSVYQQSLSFINAATKLVIIDLSRLQASNSAALAVIINWMRLAKKTGVTINFRNMPVDIASLAKSSGLDKIIQPHLI